MRQMLSEAFWYDLAGKLGENIEVVCVTGRDTEFAETATAVLRFLLQETPARRMLAKELKKTVDDWARRVLENPTEEQS